MAKHTREDIEQRLTALALMLFYMPLNSIGGLAAATGSEYYQIRRDLKQLYKRGLVTYARLGRTLNVQDRYWLGAAGVHLVCATFGIPVQWQVSEAGIKRLIARLPTVETVYNLAPSPWGHEGIIRINPFYRTADPDEPPITFPPDLRLETFSWFRSANVHAMSRYENGAWLLWEWVGVHTTIYRMLDKAERAAEEFGTQFGDMVDRPKVPAGWVMIGADRLAALHATEAWPADNVLAITTDEVVQRLRPTDFTSPISEEAHGVRLGRPETVVDWVNQDPVMKVLNGKRNFIVFMYICEWWGVTLKQLKRKFPGYQSEMSAAVNELIAAGLVVRLDGAYYPTRLGGLTSAHLDRVAPQAIYGRLAHFLQEDGRYRRRVQRHDQMVIDVGLAMDRPGIAVHHGERRVVNLAGDAPVTRPIPQDDPDDSDDSDDGQVEQATTQLSPDAVVLVQSADGRYMVHYLELELAAANRAQAIRRLRPYRLAQQQHGESPLVIVVCPNREIERLYHEEGAGLLLLTTTVDEAVLGPFVGPDSVLRYFGERASIDRLGQEKRRRMLDTLPQYIRDTVPPQMADDFLRGDFLQYL